MKNEQLSALINYMIREELSGYSSVSEESKEELAQYVGAINETVDTLLYKFFFINNQITDNGGTPVLKQILNDL